jgi:hypothetical protein
MAKKKKAKKEHKMSKHEHEKASMKMPMMKGAARGK